MKTISLLSLSFLFSYIIGFRITIELLDDEFWNEKILAAWDLAVPPKCERWWNEDYGHKGTKDWKF